ncbi:mechanosensitive ion channel family protein, partial [Vibrio astriarenae]
MFHVLIKHDNGNLITYPNNLMLQKAVLKLTAPKPDTQKSTSRIYTRRKQNIR